MIGTLARQAVAQDANVVMVSGDKDFQQLVRPSSLVAEPGSRRREQWVSVENAAERLGVEAKHVTDYLALVGDCSDNVPSGGEIG